MADHGPSIIFFFLEKGPVAIASAAVPVAAALTWVSTTPSATLLSPSLLLAFLGWLVALPLLVLVAFSIGMLVTSWRTVEGGSAKADWSDYLEFSDPKMNDYYRGFKIPVDVVYEHYINQELEFKKDFYEVFQHRNEIFRFAFTLYHAKYFLGEFRKQVFGHGDHQDKEEVAPVYDRGNDFYGWFLGERMKYSCAVWRSDKPGEDNLEDAQDRMLDLVCEQCQMKKGSRHFDFGCGWGTLVTHAASRFGTDSTGITLSKEQAKAGEARASKHKVSNKVHIHVKDYREFKDRKAEFDSITCLEMAEHVGIKNFQAFLQQVKYMLKDDGVFYLQIAGLRRAWQFEDLIWGLFMSKYIFPGADASCPLGFVTSQLERAGFEVHRVENTGTHYALTIKAWYDNWVANKDKVVEKYGEKWYRLWVVFLGWSAIIAFQGTSTAFMVTVTKNHANDAKSIDGSAAINRTAKFVGKKTIGIQQ